MAIGKSKGKSLCSNWFFLLEKISNLSDHKDVIKEVTTQSGDTLIKLAPSQLHGIFFHLLDTYRYGIYIVQNGDNDAHVVNISIVVLAHFEP